MLSVAFRIGVFEAEEEPWPAEGPLDSMFEFRVGTLISDCWGISPSFGGASDIADRFCVGGFEEITKAVATFVSGRGKWMFFGVMGLENDRNGVGCGVQEIREFLCPFVFTCLMIRIE